MSSVLVLTVGLPRSGKSTWARKQSCPIVNPDAIRLALHGEAFIPDAERMVWAIAHYMVRSLFLAGHSRVIVDATNTTRKRRDAWKSPYWVREYREFLTEPRTCIKRAKNDGREDLIPVIERMGFHWEDIEDEEQEDATETAKG